MYDSHGTYWKNHIDCIILRIWGIQIKRPQLKSKIEHQIKRKGLSGRFVNFSVNSLGYATKGDMMITQHKIKKWVIYSNSDIELCDLNSIPTGRLLLWIKNDRFKGFEVIKYHLTHFTKHFRWRICMQNSLMIFRCQSMSFHGQNLSDANNLPMIRKN